MGSLEGAQSRHPMALVALAMSFVTLLLVANIIAVKPLALDGWILPAGVIAYPFTFLVTDTISEIYGRKVATRVVWYGFGLSIAMVVLVYIAKVLPAASFWQGQDDYDTILGSVPRIVLGSMSAYIVSQHIDVVMFHLVRRITTGRHLWLRNNASTIVSQAIDTVLFISIAFAGSVPTAALWNMMATQYVVKVFIAALDTPLVYALVGAIRTKNSYDIEATEPAPMR